MAEADHQSSENCAQCGVLFTPIKPKRGRPSSKCLVCYPADERRRNLQKVTRSKSRSRGEFVPTLPPPLMLELERPCSKCGRSFKVWVPERGPKPTRCEVCYPPERREFMRRWAAGEHRPEIRQCARCGENFPATKGKRHHCDTCRPVATKETVSARQKELWAARLAENPKPPCRECGSPVSRSNARFFCSEPCQLKHGRRINSALRRSRTSAKRPEKINPIAIFERDGWHCYRCHKHTPPELRGTYHDDAPEVDHVYPLARGGAHTSFNCSCICRKCNGEKSDSFGPRDEAQLMAIMAKTQPRGADPAAVSRILARLDEMERRLSRQ